MFAVCTTGDTAHIDMIFKFLPHTCVNMGALCLYRHPVSVNCLYHARMVLSVGGSFAYFAWNARCTATTDLLRDIPTHKTTSIQEQPFSHYIHSHRLAAEMWITMKNNLLGENFSVVPSVCTGLVNTCPTVFISVINQLGAQKFCFTISLFHTSTCFEHMYSSSGGQNCVTQALVSSNL